MTAKKNFLFENVPNLLSQYIYLQYDITVVNWCLLKDIKEPLLNEKENGLRPPVFCP